MIDPIDAGYSTRQINTVTMRERQRCIDIVKKYSDGPHCCLLGDDGEVEEQFECTCWRSKIIQEMVEGE